VFAVSAVLVNGVPTSNVVYRPPFKDTLSTRQKGRAVTAQRYPGWPQHKVWNVTGGPAEATSDLYYFLLPKVMPVQPGSAFQAELHVLFDGGAAGWLQSLQDCVLH
jgi:hypothetical protein